METSLKMRQTLRMTRPEAAKLQSMTRLLSMGTMQKLAMQRWHQMLERPMTSFKPSVRWTSRGRHTRRPERSAEKFRNSEASFVESSPWSRGRQPLPKRKSAVDAQLAIASVIGLATLSVPSQGNLAQRDPSDVARTTTRRSRLVRRTLQQLLLCISPWMMMSVMESPTLPT